jgi:hypothetical protein
MCRATLLQANHDVARAKALLEDPEFVRMSTDFDLGEMAKLGEDNPMRMVEHMMLQQGAHGAAPGED